MRSIRVSLILYFLGLLLVALGAASAWAYHLANSALEEKKVKTVELIESQYRERCRQEEVRLNDALLFQAQTLARMAYFYSDSTKANNYRVLTGLGALTAAMGPNAWAPVYIDLMQSNRHSPYSFLVWRKSVAEIRFNEFELFQHVDGQVAEFFQIDSSWGSSFRSASLGTARLPGQVRQFAVDEAISWEFDTTTLGKSSLRRVVLKVPATRLLPFGALALETPRPSFRSQPSGRPSSGRDPGRGPVPYFPIPGPRPSLVIQCACDIKTHLATLDGLQARRTMEQAELEAETTKDLATLHQRLWWLGGITFAAMIMGTLGIVSWGMHPLRRLSAAVGQVSTKDFKLPLDNKRRMPAELQPIVQHLTATLEMLKRAFAREKQATADISHELRTPLATMLTTTELALRKPRSAEEYREMLVECRAGAKQMNAIIERLLTLARLDAGVDMIRPQPVNVALLAEQCLATVRPLAQARGIQVRVCLDPNVQVNTDPDKLREVLTNLLHNAVQYNRPDGTIELEVHDVAGRVHVEVRDTGIGIAPEAQSLIFERFFRVDPSRTSDGLNAGLGLAIVKEYVELLGGTILVESQPGKGTTFRVDLPPVVART